MREQTESPESAILLGYTHCVIDGEEDSIELVHIENHWYDMCKISRDTCFLIELGKEDIDNATNIKLDFSHMKEEPCEL